MSEATIRTALYNLLSGVNNIGKVYDYERWAADWGKFITLFKTTISGKEQIRGWEIGRKAPIGDHQEDHGSVRTHTYFIRGYMGVEDAAATEKTFNALIETICALFRVEDNKDLSGAGLGVDYPQVDALDTRSFGSVLCHFCEMTLTIYEHIA